MKRSTYKLNAKASVSLCSLFRSRTKKARSGACAESVGFIGEAPGVVGKQDLVDILIECTDAESIQHKIGQLETGERISAPAEGYVSARLRIEHAEALASFESVQRMQSKKRSRPTLKEAAKDIGLRSGTAAARQVAETGKDVLIAVVDTGFDLSHPMFRDSNGQLRVARLLDQTDANREFDTAELEAAWQAGGARPGFDADGHGTHVASIAGGSFHGGLEGVAPGARFLLVKTDFINTDDAVSWAFAQAGDRPCVVNLSLGHHFGAHDGSDAVERLHESLSGPGKIIVAAAGNEREDAIHIGGHFVPNQTRSVTFDVLRQVDGNQAVRPSASLTLWYDRNDDFDIALVTPTGQKMSIPALGNTDRYGSTALDIELSRRSYVWSDLVQVQIHLGFASPAAPTSLLFGWGIEMTCKAALVGRLDGWVSNSGFAEFRAHPLVESARTIGLPATGRACIAVASHVSKNAWKSDLGAQTDTSIFAGRSSPFSSQGPTRDGRRKPEISAPGQYLTAALANGSTSSARDDLAHGADRILSIAGTSMAAPIVAGTIALMLQKKGTLGHAEVRQALLDSARLDPQTGPGWSPAYGFGKIDLPKAMSRV